MDNLSTILNKIPNALIAAMQSEVTKVTDRVDCAHLRMFVPNTRFLQGRLIIDREKETATVMFAVKTEFVVTSEPTA